MPMRYLTSVIDVYEHVLKKPSSYSDKVKQEILHGLGNISVFILVTPLSLYLHHSQVSFR
jgi:hypothetical protein